MFKFQCGENVIHLEFIKINKWDMAKWDISVFDKNGEEIASAVDAHTEEKEDVNKAVNEIFNDLWGNEFIKEWGFQTMFYENPDGTGTHHLILHEIKGSK